jgi:hypothetical protein
MIVVIFKVHPLGSYSPMPALSPPFKTILELVLWNGLRASVVLLLISSKVYLSIFPLSSGTKKSLGARSGE